MLQQLLQTVYIHPALPELIRDAARDAAGRQNRDVIFVGYVLGTDKDPQHLHSQIEKLKSAGVVLGKTNAHAARIAAEIIKGIN